MSWGNNGASSAATRRIRFFSVGVWLVAAVVVVIITSLSTLATNNGTFDRDYPWEDRGLTEATSEGDGEWSGDGNSVIHLASAEPVAGGYEVELLSDESVTLYYGSYVEGGDYPEYVGLVWDDEPLVLVTSLQEVDIWVEADGPWRLKFSPIDAVEITDKYSSRGNALLVYHGSARSAVAKFVGEGVFFVTVYTSDDRTMPIIESEPITERIYWEGDGTAYFRIESDVNDGAWSIDIELLADETPAPSSIPSTTATPTPGG